MAPRFVTKTMHAYLDYPVAFSLMIPPFVLQLGSSSPLALWLAVVAGVAAFVLTLFTDHQFGLVRVIPYKAHVAVDFLVGVGLPAGAIFARFTGIDAWYCWINAAAVITVVSLNEPFRSESASHAPA